MTSFQVTDDLLEAGLELLDKKSTSKADVALDGATAGILILAELVKQLRTVNENLEEVADKLNSIRPELDAIRAAVNRE